MTNNTYKYLLSDLKKLKGVGVKTSNLLKRKKINTMLIKLHFPSFIFFFDSIIIFLWMVRLI